MHNLDIATGRRAPTSTGSATRAIYEDFSNSIDGLSQATSYSALGVYGRGRDWTAGVVADHWQLADYTLTDAVLPYDRLPRAFVNWERRVGGLAARRRGCRGGALPSPASTPPARAWTCSPWIGAPLEGDAWFLRPTLAWRYTGYPLDRRTGDRRWAAGSPSRAQSIFSVDTGLFFDRETQVKGKSYLQTLEPRLFYLNVPYEDQGDLPLFDTQPLTFSWGQLFRDNRYSGADRQADANQLTLACQLAPDPPGGRPRDASPPASARSATSKESLVRAAERAGHREGASAWVADVNYAPTDRWTIGASYQWDPKFSRDRPRQPARALPAAATTASFNLGYRYRRAPAGTGGLLLPVPAERQLEPGRPLLLLAARPQGAGEPSAGVQWDSCCVAVRLVARRYVHNRAGELSNALHVRDRTQGPRLGRPGHATAPCAVRSSATIATTSTWCRRRQPRASLPRRQRERQSMTFIHRLRAPRHLAALLPCCCLPVARPRRTPRPSSRSTASPPWSTRT